MRALIQRVSQASVTIAGQVTAKIDRGLLVYLGVEAGDGNADIEFILDKVAGLRIFEDDQGKMNLDVRQAGGSLLVVSAFTMLADARKGRRPSFDRAAEPAIAEQMYLRAVERWRSMSLHVDTGTFRAEMHVASVNDGPVMQLLDSHRLF